MCRVCSRLTARLAGYSATHGPYTRYRSTPYLRRGRRNEEPTTQLRSRLTASALRSGALTDPAATPGRCARCAPSRGAATCRLRDGDSASARSTPFALVTFVCDLCGGTLTGASTGGYVHLIDPDDGHAVELVLIGVEDRALIRQRASGIVRLDDQQIDVLVAAVLEVAERRRHRRQSGVTVIR